MSSPACAARRGQRDVRRRADRPAPGLSDRAPRHRAHVPDRAAVPANDRARQRGSRCDVRRPVAQCCRSARPRGRMSRFHRPRGGRRSIPASPLTLPDRKRLELAKGLATKPRLLLLDEVNAGLNCDRDRRRARADPGDCRARHHHPSDRASDEGRDARLFAGHRAASGGVDFRRPSERCDPRSAGHRGLSRRRLCRATARSMQADDAASQRVGCLRRLWRCAGAARRRSQREHGRDRLPDRIERRRQDHAAANPVRVSCGRAAGAITFDGRRLPDCRRRTSSGAVSSMCRKAGACSPA